MSEQDETGQGSAAMPRVSVVIPTRNRLGYLQQALAGALAQSDVMVEVIVVDEGSTDETPEWLSGHGDERVRVIRHDVPVKLPGARNAGLRAVTSPWVAFLDDDDVWAPRKLAAQVRAAEEAQVDWSYVAEVVVDEDLQLLDVSPFVDHTEIADVLPLRNMIPAGGSGVLVRTEVLRRLGGFDEDLRAAEDWDCWLRLLQHGPPASTSELLVAYRRSAGSMSMQVDEMEKGYQQFRNKHPLPDDQNRRAHVLTQRYYAFQLARSGATRDAVRRLRRTARTSPKNIVLIAWVLLARREWPTRAMRMASNSAAQAEVNAWLQPLRDVQA